MMDTIAGPTLLTAGRCALAYLQVQRHELVVAASLLDDDLQPVPETLDARTGLVVAQLDSVIEDLASAIHKAERFGWRPPPAALRRWLSFLHLVWIGPVRTFPLERSQ